MGIINPLGLPHARRTLMIYSNTGEGKTGQIGELAKEEFERSGKKTLLHTMDHGGYETILHLVEDDLIDVVPAIGRALPWEWISPMTLGRVPMSDGIWGPIDPEKYGIVAFDGASGLGDLLLRDLAQKAASGRNVTGQGPSIRFQEGSTMVVNNAPAHFGLVQSRIAQAFQDSFTIPVELVIWTALARGAEEETTSSGIVGPMVAGKALTASVPQMFNYTFRLSAIPPNPALGIEGSSRLYLNPHIEGVSAGSKGLANPRAPVGIKVPDFIEPASVSAAMALIDDAREKARSAWGERKAKLAAKLAAKS